MVDPASGTCNAFADIINTTRHINEPVKSTIRHDADDWTSIIPNSEHIELFRNVKWANTPLGDLSSWNHALRLHIYTLFADTRPSCIYWGPSRITIYNASLIPLTGKLHPALMGQTFKQAFPELCELIEPVFDMAERTGFASNVNEQQAFTDRNGFSEEAYFDGVYIPLRGIEGKIEGIYNTTYEITKHKIADRRTTMLNAMTVPSKPPTELTTSYILPCLQRNPYDIPMALIYRVDGISEPGKGCLRLTGSIGIPPGHSLAKKELDMVGDDPLLRLLREAESEIITMPVDASFDGVDWKGFGEPSKSFSIISVQKAGELAGFIVLGANPRRPVDEDYHQFMRDIHSKACSLVAAVTSAEETVKHRQRLERELERSEKQTRFFAQHASVGMQNLSIDGKTVIWVNENFHQIIGMPREAENIGHIKLPLIDNIVAEDRAKARDSFHQVVQGHEHVSVELRLHRMFEPPFGESENACVLALSLPYWEDGKVSSVMTCITDVSRLKWAERVEARKAQEALEAQRLTNEFIDMISHEMRNPLSAIFQCADFIQDSARFDESFSPNVLTKALRDNIEAAHTISMCAKHQKTIVDDVLTLSKLEHIMLSISPEPIKLKSLVERVVKMFEPDVSSHRIKLEAKLKVGFGFTDTDWVQCDASRMNQIFVNLITNSIKFTRNQERREITIQYGATTLDPRSMFPENMAWAANQRVVQDLTMNPDWGHGEHIYLCVQVSDTGVGLTADEIKKLFARFEQVGCKTKTMIKHEGSGLGLFISQRLTEIQGGEIGVMSVPNEGSTFAFYVKSRRAETDVVVQMKKELGRKSRCEYLLSPVSNGISNDPIHVLLVEDNLINQKLLQKQLIRSGCIVHVANHGAEALKFLRETNLWHESSGGIHVDIILMDWEMPEMDGLICTSKIRQLQMEGKVTRHVQVLGVTANAREEQINSALASGMDSVITKPFVIADLLVKMRERLRGVED